MLIPSQLTSNPGLTLSESIQTNDILPNFHSKATITLIRISYMKRNFIPSLRSHNRQSGLFQTHLRMPSDRWCELKFVITSSQGPNRFTPSFIWYQTSNSSGRPLMTRNLIRLHIHHRSLRSESTIWQIPNHSILPSLRPSMCWILVSKHEQPNSSCCGLGSAWWIRS